MAFDGKVTIQTVLDTKKATTQAKGLGNTLKSGLAKGTKIATAGLTAIATAGTATAGAMVKATKATMEYGVEVNRNSQKLNMSKKGYQEWSYVLKRSGTSIDSLRMGMKKISTAIDEAKNGSKSATENFKRLGLSVDDLKGKSQEEIFGVMVKRLQGIKDTTERSAIANKFFGRSAQEMAGLLNKSGKDVEGLKKQAHDLGLVLSDDAIKKSAEFRGKLTELQSTFEGLRNKMAVKFLPSLTKVTDGLSLIAQGKTEVGLKKIEEGVREFTTQLNKMTPKLLQLGGTILKSLGKGLLNNLPTLLDAGAKIVASIISGIAKAIPILIRKLPQIFKAVKDALIGALDSLAKELPSALGGLASVLSGVVSLFGGLVETLTSSSTAGAILRGVLFGLIGAYVAYKVAVGLATIAMGLFNLVMNANPIFLMVTAIGALVGVMIALANAMVDEEPSAKVQAINAETEAIKQRTEARNAELQKEQELANQHSSQIGQTQESINGHIAEMNEVRRLAGELDNLVDAQGRVKEGKRAQVDFILNQLNGALGTEYKLVGNQVQQYEKLRSSIFRAIDAKTSELLLQDAEKGYTDAVKRRTDAQKKTNKALIDYTTAKTEFDKYQMTNQPKINKLEKEAGKLAWDGKIKQSKAKQAEADALKAGIQARYEDMLSAEKSYKKNKNEASKYYAEMIRYRSAYQASAKGNNKKAQDLLAKSVGQYKALGEKITDGVASGMTDGEAMKMVDSAVGTITKKTLKALKKKWNIKSPSRVAKKEIGENIGAGIALGIADGFANVDPFSQLNADIMTSAGKLQSAINTSLDIRSNMSELQNAVTQGMENANIKMQVGERDFARTVKGALA